MVGCLFDYVGLACSGVLICLFVVYYWFGLVLLLLVICLLLIVGCANVDVGSITVYGLLFAC